MSGTDPTQPVCYSQSSDDDIAARDAYLSVGVPVLRPQHTRELNAVDKAYAQRGGTRTQYGLWCLLLDLNRRGLLPKLGGRDG